jgi:hypothetical protein
MVKHLVVSNGQDPLTKPIIDYLIETYGIPPKDIRCVTLISRVGDVQVIDVELAVWDDPRPGVITLPPDLTEDEVEEFKRSWVERFGRKGGVVTESIMVGENGPEIVPPLSHEGSDRWIGGDRKDEK